MYEGETLITLSVPAELCQRFRKAFPGETLNDIIYRSFLRTLGDAELKRFAAEKQAEVQAEARRLNEEFGLA